MQKCYEKNEALKTKLDLKTKQMHLSTFEASGFPEYQALEAAARMTGGLSASAVGSFGDIGERRRRKCDDRAGDGGSRHPKSSRKTCLKREWRE